MLYSTPPAPLATALKAAVAAGDDKIRDPLSPQAANGSPVASPELPISFGPAKRASKQGRDGAALDNSDHEQEAIASDSGPSSIHLSNGHSADTASDPQNADHIVVHGVVHQISHAEMRQVIKTESGGGSGNRGYYAAKVQCELYEGGCVQALALLTHPNSMHHQVSSIPIMCNHASLGQ